MMRYYAQYNSNGKLVAVGTGPGGMEITKAEYDAILLEIREKAALTEQLYKGEIALDDVPVQWRGEIQSRVEARKAADAEAAGQEISGEEFLDMLEEVL